MASADNQGSRHVVAVVGGATAGSEIARVLSERGAAVVVLEQNPRPYGKIEDGLPRWHAQQRRDEYEEINGRLDRPNVHYVPMTRLGADVNFKELVEGWGLSALVLANGAWRDRPFPVEGADEFIDRGLVYQNSLIYWFNHYLERNYNGPRYELCPGMIVCGGGLASIDVVKVIQIEMTLKALAARGITEDMVRLEREGIEPVLQKYGLTWAGLGIAPCKLLYRRRVIDMPLSDIPPDAPPKRAEALIMARGKILEKAQRKFLFEFHPTRLSTSLVVENGRLVGFKVSKTEVVEGKAKILPDPPEEIRGQLTISSVGSIPMSLPGIPQRGETYSYVDQKIGLMLDSPIPVFAAGNVLTGKGNIKDSLESGTEIGIRLAESYLGLSDEKLPLAEGARQQATKDGENVAKVVEQRAPLRAEAVEDIMRRVRERQRAVGYEGNYRGWLAKVTPADLQ